MKQNREARRPLQGGGIGQDTLVVRRLGFLDAFFLSFGGQSILLSLMTYGAAVITLSGYFSPVAVALGAALVLVNGAVVQHLSSKYAQNGGYYNYAKSIREKIGVHTGLLYTFYALLYGGAYIVGTSFIVSYVSGLNPAVISLPVTLAAILLVWLGVKPSSRYAVATGVLEIGVILFFVVESMLRTHFALFDPLTQFKLSSGIPLAILLGASIPTGYGVLAQVSGEVVEAEKNVGRAMVSVIILGGFLASIFVLSIANLAHAASLRAHSLDAQTLLSVALALNPAARPIIVFSVLSDGVLGATAYLTAGTRTLWKMSQDGHMPKLFGSLRRGEPVNSLVVLAPLYLIVSSVALLFMSPFKAFIALGVIAGLCSLYVHFTANISLLSQRWKSRLLDKWKIIALAATAYTAFNLAFSLLEGKILYAEMFFMLASGALLYVVLKKVDKRGRDTRSFSVEQ